MGNINLDIKHRALLELETLGGGAYHEIFQLLQNYFHTIHVSSKSVLLVGFLQYWTFIVVNCDP